MKTRRQTSVALWAITVTAVVLLATAGSAFAQSRCQTGWTKYAGNPVMERCECDYECDCWDAEPGWSRAVLLEGGTFHMWYAAYQAGGWGEAIGYATSVDGVEWSKYPGNPVMAAGTGDDWDQRVLPETVILQDQTYTMWYTSGVDVAPGVPGVGVATSADGIVWTKHPGNPVLTGDAGTLDAAGPMFASVVFDGETYRMWYTARDDEYVYPDHPLFVGYATSPDGVAWVKHPEPVLGVGDWWDTELYALDVVFDGDTFHMFYDGIGQNTGSIGYATSPDGVSWTKGGGHGGPILRAGYMPSDWDYGFVLEPTVLFDSGTAHMWYRGWDGVSVEDAIGYATASLDNLFDPPHTLSDNRFAVSVWWWDADNNAGEAVPAKLTDDSGYFWFFDEDNIELVVKVLDGCAVNGNYWVFAAGLTNVGATIIITDTQTMQRVTYINTLGEAFQPIQDIGAFAVCD